MVLNRAKEYYKNNKGKLKQQAKDKYNIPEEKIKKIEYVKNKYYTMPEEQKNKRREYERNRYRNMSEEEKNKRKEYARNRYHMMIKAC